MKDFITGVEEKYDKRLLEGRLTAEGNVIALLFADPLLLDELELTSKDFITKDGTFYFALAKQLRKAGYSVFDEVTILSSISDNILDAFNERGGYETIKNMVDVVNSKNADVYIDTLYKENIILGLYRDGFDLFKVVQWNEKEIIPFELFKKMDSEGVLDWYESRLSTYGVGYISTVTEEGELDFSDEYFEHMDSGEEVGVPFDFAGDDINLEEMRCLPFISDQIGGYYDGTFNVLAGHSSVGKSCMWTTIAMALLHHDRKVLIISNEQKMKAFQDNFLVFILYKYFRYYDITKKKIRSAALNDKDKEMRKKAQDYWRKYYKGRVKFIAITDANMKIVKKKIRENVLIHGYDTVIYDTMKVEFSENSNDTTWVSLIRDSREFDKLAKKYNIIMLASLQLAMNSKGNLFLDGSELSMSKQSIEVMESLLLMRSVYTEELTKDNKKYYCNPFQHKKIDGKWVEEEYEPDPTATYKALFIGKSRNGANSNDLGIGYLLKFDGGHGIFKEVAKARFKHGKIGSM